ncbi:hypothetical protein EDC01DRAFT_661493 [Geopyxis carbonaria]|nr:hypothetical protein EDC01DRAFT_661493 [Geopyxis carbonaria]
MQSHPPAPAPPVYRIVNGVSFSYGAGGFAYNNYYPLSAAALHDLASAPPHVSYPPEFWFTQLSYHGVEIVELTAGVHPFGLTKVLKDAARALPRTVRPPMSRESAGAEGRQESNTPQWIVEISGELAREYQRLALTHADFLSLSPAAACTADTPRFLTTYFGLRRPALLELSDLPWPVRKRLPLHTADFPGLHASEVLTHTHHIPTVVLGWDAAAVHRRAGELKFCRPEELASGHTARMRAARAARVKAEVEMMRASVAAVAEEQRRIGIDAQRRRAEEEERLYEERELRAMEAEAASGGDVQFVASVTVRRERDHEGEYERERPDRLAILWPWEGIRRPLAIEPYPQPRAQSPLAEQRGEGPTPDNSLKRAAEDDVRRSRKYIKREPMSDEDSDPGNNSDEDDDDDDGQDAYGAGPQWSDCAEHRLSSVAPPVGREQWPCG